MSLFSGIKFSAAAAATASSSSSFAPPPPPPTKAPTPPPPAEPTPANPEVEGATATAPALSAAALALAPRKPKPKPAAPRPAYIPPPPPEADIIRAASPKLIDREQQHDILGPDGEKLAKAPAMTLAPAKKSVKRNRKGRKIKVKEKQKQERGNGQSVKALKRKAKRRAETVFHAFDPDEPYDPNRPNDLTEYQAYRKREREERRQRLIESKKRKLAGGRSSDESDSDDSSEEEVRRDAPRMFAPPRNYSPPPALPTSAPPPPAPTMTHASTGDDAYARRLAMSTAATGDDAYARRMALSQAGPSSYAPPPPPPQHRPPPPPPPPQQSQPPPPPRQTFAPSQPSAPTYTAPPPPAPMPVQIAAPVVSKAEDPEAFQKLVEQKMAAAAAVAARLASMAANRPPASAPIVDDPNATFAEKMMRRWGHQEGSGLGTDGSGIVHALSAEHANAPKATKRNKFKPGKWVQAPNAMGKIVNLNDNERARIERETKGESSRVVCLVGVVDGPDAVDDELGDEIGEECNNLGVVERVVLHMVSPPPPEPWKCLRAFVVFSGPAGAWRAIKELDGRYFGGRQLEVTYFDEARFHRGDRDGPLLTT